MIYTVYTLKFQSAQLNYFFIISYEISVYNINITASHFIYNIIFCIRILQ